MSKNQKVLIHFFIFGYYMVVLVSCRHQHKRNQIQPNSECFYQYPNIDHYQSLAEWVHAKNSSRYSPIVPYKQELVDLQPEDFRDGLRLTSGHGCHLKKSKEISEHMPMNEKALCPFEYVLNYNPNRIPAALTEARCSCQKPSGRYMRSHIADCQPLYYSIRVLLFDEKCSSYKEHVEAISMGCLPVLRALHGVENDHHDLLNIINAEVPD